MSGATSDERATSEFNIIGKQPAFGQKPNPFQFYQLDPGDNASGRGIDEDTATFDSQTRSDDVS